MTMTDLTEAEIQLLIVLIELAQPQETPNNNHYRFYPRTVEEAAAYFKSFRQDWTDAYASLETRGLIQPAESAYRLTSQGIRIACQVRDERPPIYYWYKEFYTLTATSRAYATFCERLYGKNLCQAGFSDMEQIEKLFDVIQPGQDSRILDIGCGTGMVAEYLADQTGARVWGVDYSPEAIQQALDRTQAKHDRPDFSVANMDTLDFADESFDTIISIDTLYMPADLEATLRKLMAMLRPGGQLAVFYSHAVWDASRDRTTLLPANTPLGVALRNLGLAFRTWDLTEQTYRLMQHKRQIGEEMRQAFEVEGNQALFDFIVAESEASSAPFDLQTCTQSRFLYHVCKRGREC